MHRERGFAGSTFLGEQRERSKGGGGLGHSPKIALFGNSASLINSAYILRCQTFVSAPKIGLPH